MPGHAGELGSRVGPGVDEFAVDVQGGVLAILGRNEVMPSAVAHPANRTSGLVRRAAHPVAQRGGVAEPQDPAFVSGPGVVAHQDVARTPAEPALHGPAVTENRPTREELATTAVEAR